MKKFIQNFDDIFKAIIGDKSFKEFSFINVPIKFLSKNIERFKFDSKRQSAFLSVFAELMQVGRLPYDIADYQTKYGQKIEAKISADIKRNLSEGLNVTDALEGWIEPLNLAALKAGEASGHEGFVKALRHVSGLIQSQNQASSSSFSKCLYPGLYTILSVVFIAAIYTNFVPVIEEISVGKPLPIEVKNFKDFVEFWIAWGIPILVCLTAYIATFKYLEKNLVGDIRDQIEMIKIGSWQPFGGYRLKIGSHIVSSFALLKRFDFPAYTIYRILSNEGDKYQRHHISIMQKQLKEGHENEISSLDSGLLEPQYVSLLSLYAGANQSIYVEALNSAAREIQERCNNRMKVTGTLLSYFLWIILIKNLAALITILMSVNFN